MIKHFQADQIYTPRGEDGFIGRGSYGVIRICKTSLHKRVVAKCFSTTSSEQDIDAKIKRFQDEASVLHRLQHQNIVAFHGIVKWKGSFAILMEYLAGGNVCQLLHKRNVKVIPWPLRLRIAFELSDAISWLHSGYKPGKVLIHGDIKPENILFSDNIKVKLADFGSVNLHLSDDASITTLNLPPNSQHTPLFAAPELLDRPRILRTTEMDVYSYSMVLYELISRKRVFENVQLSRNILYQVIIEREQRPDVSFFQDLGKQLSSEDQAIFTRLKEIMKESWLNNPKKRPKMAAVRDRLLHILKRLNPQMIRQQAAIVAKNVGLRQLINDGSWVSLDRFFPPFMEVKAPMTKVLSSSLNLKEEEIEKLLDETNCFKIRAHAIECKYEKLKEKSKIFITNNFETLTSGEEFKNLSFNDVVEILDLVKKEISSENLIFSAIIGWIRKEHVTRVRHFEKLFILVDLGNLPRNFITGVIAQEDLVLNSHRCCKILIRELLRHIDLSDSNALSSTPELFRTTKGLTSTHTTNTPFGSSPSQKPTSILSVNSNVTVHSNVTIDVRSQSQ